MKLYRGNIVYSQSRERLVSIEGGYIAVENGVIEGIYDRIPQNYEGVPVEDFGDSVIIPAFSDLHVHAPQYPQRGLAMDQLLYDWLNKYTFPLEAKYADMEFARQVYDAFLQDMIENGTMHACVFGTIHRTATGYLLERMEDTGFRAFVGKVNMDKASPDYLCETTEESLRETEAYLDAYKDNRYAKPMITPRFAPTCTDGVIRGLGELAKKYHVGMQTHIVESKWEASQALIDFPDASCDMEIYERAGLLDYGPVVAAHFIFPSDEDIRILKEHGGFAVQCPDATVNVIAGIMQNATLNDKGVNLALGSDIAGGHNIGVYSQVARAVQLSKLKWFYEPEGNRPIRFEEAFYMATKQGGQIFGKVGSLEPGYEFDAIVIDNMSDSFAPVTPAESVERFCYYGNKSNIRARFLKGKRL